MANRLLLLAVVAASLGVGFLLLNQPTAMQAEKVSSSEILTVASWNIQFLSEDKFEYARVAIEWLIKDQKVDILALQEVSYNEEWNPIERIASELGHYGYCISAEIGDKSRNLAYIFNTDTIEIAAEAQDHLCTPILRVALSDPDMNMGKNRPAALLWFKSQSGFDGLLVNVHLRASDCNPPTCNPRRTSQEVRNKQLGELRDGILDIWQQLNGENDIILVGDFNQEMHFSTDDCHPISSLESCFDFRHSAIKTTKTGYYDYIAPSKWLGGAMDERLEVSDVIKLWKAQLLCEALLSRAASDESACTEDLYWKQISDHYPVVATFKVK